MTRLRFPPHAARAPILLLSLLAACAEIPPDAPPAPAPAPAPAPVVEAPPARPATLEVIVPVETKAVEAPKPHPPAKPAHAAPATPAKPIATTPEATGSAPATTTAARRRSATPAPRIPVWMAGCAQRVQHAGAIQCDADALLVEPSDKVQVYTRDASKVHALPDGNAVILREGLPRLYRFFVLP